MSLRGLRVQSLSPILCCSFFLVTAAHADNIGKTVSWTVNPATVVQGQVSEVIMSAPSATCGTVAGQLNDGFLDNPTTKPSVHAQVGFNVSVGAIAHSGTCELTVTLNAASNAKTGPLRLTLAAATSAAGAGIQDTGYTTVTVMSSQASAIPDGLAQQVDADYTILPYQTTYDNYGRRIADQYYALVARIGNNTGFSLQLAGVGFSGTSTGNTDPSIVQGTLLYGQAYSARNIIYRALVWAAIIGAGASPYFHSANAKANYSAGLALLGGPIINGFSSQFPDNTVQQLARLGSSDVMTNQNVIPNNSQVGFVAFVGRDTVCPPEGATNADICGSMNKFFVHTFYDPTKVKARLGDITIVGDLLPNFKARIRVTAASSGTPPATGVASIPAVEGTPTTISLQSTSLTGASLTAPPAGITGTGVVTDSVFQISVVALSKNPSPITVALTRKDGSAVTFPVNVAQPIAVITPVGGVPIPATGTTTVSIGWQGTGPDLTNAVPSMLPADGTFVKTASTATTISGTITPARKGVLPVQLAITVNGTPITDITGPTVASQ